MACNKKLQPVLSMRRQHLRMVAHLVDGPADADDVLQQAYVRALERIHTVRDEPRLAHWFSRLLRNIAVDQRRRRRTNARALALLARENEEPIHETTSKTVGCRCALGLIQRLPLNYAAVLRGAYLDQRSIDDLAEHFETTANNVRVRLHRARTALRRLLGDYCQSCRADGFSACNCRANDP